MQCYSELVPPSGITHSLAAPFVSAGANNLIVARTSLLQIFEVRSPDQGHDSKLVLVAEHRLSGTVTALGRVHVEDLRSGGDAVLIAFRDAKLSLVEWDPTQHSISTISIHYYENHALQAAPWMPDLQYCVSHLTIDPNSRCAAFNFGVGSLAIIPFHQAGDDLAMDDDLDDMDGIVEERTRSKHVNGLEDGHATPYFPSFVLPMTALDPGLLHPVDLTFLHEYRDPTIGILYSTAARSNNLAVERRDVTIYSVYALDIEQRASTTLQSVKNLPNDIHSVFSLPLPVSGSLLVGGNEIIHIDQGGKATGLSVNEFARESSSFPMTDQSSLRLRLEGSQVAQLDRLNGDVLLITKSGQLFVLSFRLDGRSVSGMSLRQVDNTKLCDAVQSMPSCASTLSSGQIFIGSEAADAVLLGARRGTQLKRQMSRSHADVNGDGFENGEDDDDDMEDDDDLFAGDRAASANLSQASGTNLHLHDTLPCIAPLHDIAFGRATKRKRDDLGRDDSSALADGLELAASYGHGRAGGIAFFTHDLNPEVRKRLRHGSAQGVWPCCANPGVSERLIVSERSDEEQTTSSLWELSGGDLQKVHGTEFEPTSGEPIAVGVFTSTSRTIFVTGSEIRVYNAGFGISQIVPIVDEDEGQLSRAVKASFAEPYMTLLKDDHSVTILKADKNGELEELELPQSLSAVSSDGFSAASLYVDTTDFFQSGRFHNSPSEPRILLSLLSTGGALSVIPMSNMDVQVFHVEGVGFLPTLLAPDVQLPKHWRNSDDLADAMIADLGNDVEQRPYLLIRNLTGDVILYEPFAVPGVVGSFKLKKVATRNADYNNDSTVEEDGEATPEMAAATTFTTASGHHAMLLPGSHALVIVKAAATAPQIYPIGPKSARSLCSLDGSQHADLAFVDSEGHLCLASVPPDLLLGQSPWVIHRKPLGHDITSIAYFEDTCSYVIASQRAAPFHLPRDDEFHPEWANEKTDFLPTTSESTLQLISSYTHNVISHYTFDASERVLDVKTMSLETSEITHRQQPLVVVGTGTAKGERIVTRGHIYLFSVAEVVPRPGVPESDLKLKLLSTEDVRGAVTTLAPIGSQGFVLAAQGQKCMVRGLREDMSILPVAFLDMHFYTSVSKSLPGTGLCILGDAFSGLWLIGYSEEPYKMQLLSQDMDRPSVLAADFLPSENSQELYIIAADGNGELRILQYDPENPKAERGKKLLLRSTFNTGDAPTTMRLVPRTLTSYEAAVTAPPTVASPGSGRATPAATSAAIPKYQLLITHASGAISLITTVDDASYRRLSTLQNILTSQMEHPCGLNPRAFRDIETDGMGGRGMIDGDVARRWLELSSQHKASVADKSGARAVWDIRADLEAVLGGGMDFMA